MKNNIFIIAQQFYGNRTGTEIRKEEADFFIHGILANEISYHKDVVFDRKTVKVPGTDNLVIVYDQGIEDEYVNVRFPEYYAEENEEYREFWGEDIKMIVSCKIPEIGFEIHTRCFACRIDKNGELCSLEDGDCEKFIQYFPVK